MRESAQLTVTFPNIHKPGARFRVGTISPLVLQLAILHAAREKGQVSHTAFWQPSHDSNPAHGCAFSVATFTAVSTLCNWQVIWQL